MGPDAKVISLKATAVKDELRCLQNVNPYSFGFFPRNIGIDEVSNA